MKLKLIWVAVVKNTLTGFCVALLNNESKNILILKTKRILSMQKDSVICTVSNGSRWPDYIESVGPEINVCVGGINYQKSCLNDPNFMFTFRIKVTLLVCICVNDFHTENLRVFDWRWLFGSMINILHSLDSRILFKCLICLSDLHLLTIHTSILQQIM